MSQARPVSSEKEALNSSEVCSTDFARCGSNLQDNNDHTISSSLNSIPFSSSTCTFSESDVRFTSYSTPGPSSEKIEGSTMEGCAYPETTETKHLLDDLDQLQTSTSEVNDDKGGVQDICTSDTKSSIASDSEKRENQQQGVSVEFPRSILGSSSAASAEKIDAGTLTDDCLRPLHANIEDDLAISQKKCYELQQQISQLEEQLKQSEEEKQNLQAVLGKYLFLEEKEKRRERLLGGTAPTCTVQDPDGCNKELQMSDQIASEAVDTDYGCNQYAISESSDKTNSHMPVLHINAESNSSSLQSTLNAEECTQLPNSSDDGLLSDSSCSTTVSSSDPLVNSTETTQAAEDGEVTGACAAGSKEMMERSVNLSLRTQSGPNVGNVPWSQQDAFPSAEMAAGGTHTSGAFNGTAADWERLGARPKQGRAQHSVIKQMPGEPFIPVTDGLAKDFLARHTQDKALRKSLYQSVDAEMPLFNDTPSQGTSYIDGVINVSAQIYTANDDASATMPEQGARQEAEKTNLALGNHSSSTANNESACAQNIALEDVFNRSGLPAPCSDPTGARLGSTTSWPSLVCAGGAPIRESHCVDTVTCRGSILNNRESGTYSVDSTANALVALEQRVAEACALVERVLREREEREQFGREIERKEQLIREQRARERREREEREIQEAERWPQQQEAITVRSQWLCEHYQRHCRVRFPCCTQFYPCHRCHNISNACDNEEAKACHASHLKCSHCQYEQEIGEDSEKCHACGSKIIHKNKSFHCEVCNVCLDKRLQGNHKCQPDSGHDECCICLEDAFSGCQILPCSHKVHRECAIAMIQNGIRTCPTCHHPLYSPPSE